MHRFHKIIDGYEKTAQLSHENAWELVRSMEDVFKQIHSHDEDAYWDIMKDIHVKVKGKYFDEEYAKHEVSKMWHEDNKGLKRRGEVYSVEEALDIHQRYGRTFHDKRVGHWDVYVALNCYYHDHALLYHTWFESELIKEKICEGAICFFFRDVDSEHGKVWEYFDK